MARWREAGFKPEDIILVKNDMALTPASGPAGGSRSNVMCGNAIVAACRLLVDAMKREDGTFRDYDAMIAEDIPVYYEGTWVASDNTSCDLETAQGAPFCVYMYEIFIPEVEVDTETGKVRVTRFTTVPDVGTIINRSVVDGQIYGGLAQGIGLALTEDFDDYKKHISLLGCGIPYIEDIPDELIVDYVETYRPARSVRCGRVRRSAVDGTSPRYSGCDLRCHGRSYHESSCDTGSRSRCVKESEVRHRHSEKRVLSPNS